ncbi:MAG: hybrid sensor histidine kinase/response regulator [Chloroherpetonaceae bacterium]|nr:hybrid sensor histidine kinase/response regulator [Chloroherpetonaceae bacterium]
MRRILLLIDNQSELSRFSEFLRSIKTIQYELIEESSAENALSSLSELKPDCIVIDYELKEMTGLEFLDRLTNSSGKSDYAVVMIANERDEWVSVQALKLGAQDYLIKENIAPAYFSHAVEAAIEKVKTEKELERQRIDLAKKNQELRAFAAASAYSLRTPIKIIKSGTIMLRDLQGLPSEAIDVLQAIWESVYRSNRLIEDVITYSKLGGNELTKVEISLAEFIGEIEREFGARIAETNAVLEAQITCATIKSDKVLLHSVISNLFDNAITYRKPNVDPVIKIRCKGTKKSISLIISDNGLGISPEVQEKLLNTDFFADTNEMKTGIGFAIIRKAVELLGGTIKLESVFGEGSTFTLEFPTD